MEIGPFSWQKKGKRKKKKEKKKCLSDRQEEVSSFKSTLHSGVSLYQHIEVYDLADLNGCKKLSTQMLD
uniref:Uncharacterized protein n=1 Tax=Candidozyma auris TaxID=498019 RepID=A0A0L0NUW0_CANAR